MHKAACTTKHTEVEIWGVKHILDQDTTMMDPAVRKEIIAAADELASLARDSTEFHKAMTNYLAKYYQYKKYEFIFFVREITLRSVLITSREFPLFKDVVSNLVGAVSQARRLAWEFPQ